MNISKIFKWIDQALCTHLPIEVYRFTRTVNGREQHMVKYQCFKCGKSMKGSDNGW